MLLLSSVFILVVSIESATSVGLTPTVNQCVQWNNLGYYTVQSRKIIICSLFYDTLSVLPKTT
jgi:hypothetical protein